MSQTQYNIESVEAFILAADAPERVENLVSHLDSLFFDGTLHTPTYFWPRLTAAHKAFRIAVKKGEIPMMDYATTEPVTASQEEQPTAQPVQEAQIEEQVAPEPVSDLDPPFCDQGYDGYIPDDENMASYQEMLSQDIPQPQEQPPAPQPEPVVVAEPMAQAPQSTPVAVGAPVEKPTNPAPTTDEVSPELLARLHIIERVEAMILKAVSEVKVNNLLAKLDDLAEEGRLKVNGDYWARVSNACAIRHTQGRQAA